MLKITQVAILLEVTVQQVHNYIKNKRLKATLKSGIYLIEERDYDLFVNNYFDNRHKNKGNSVTANEKDFNILTEFINDIDNDIFDYISFHTKYKDIHSIIPPINNFIAFKRNRSIFIDRVNNMKYKDIAAKYKLSEITIKKIVRKFKEGSNY